jgi:hypothetical protein
MAMNETERDQMMRIFYRIVPENRLMLLSVARSVFAAENKPQKTVYKKTCRQERRRVGR